MCVLCATLRFYAEMSEWFKEHDWKSCDAGTYPEVQILFSAPEYKRDSAILPNPFFVPIFSEKCEIPHFIPHFLHTKFATIFKKSERSDCTNSPIARVPPRQDGIGVCGSPLTRFYPLNTNQRGCVSFVWNRAAIPYSRRAYYRRPCDGACPFPGGSRHVSLPAVLSNRLRKAKHKLISLTFSGGLFLDVVLPLFQGRTAFARLDFSVAAFGLRHKSSTACTPSV